MVLVAQIDTITGFPGAERLCSYAFTLVKGQNLAEDLVENGLARIYGLRANWPDGPRSATFLNILKNLELTAREKRRGVWDEKVFPRMSDSTAAAGVPTGKK